MTFGTALFALHQLQAARLRETYRDFLQDHTYEHVANFFFGEVYAGEDTSERDRAYDKFYRRIRRVLGGDVGTCMGTIQSLQHLTLRLDHELAHILDDQLHMQEATLTVASYEQAYACKQHYLLRQQQIEMLVRTLNLAYDIFHRIGIGTGLRALHQFQKMRGDTLISGFLMRAYDAIHPLDTIQPLTQAIQERETQRLERIFTTYA